MERGTKTATAKEESNLNLKRKPGKKAKQCGKRKIKVEKDMQDTEKEIKTSG